MQKEIKVEYFAALRQQAGKRSEVIHTDAKTARDLFETLRKHYMFSLTENDTKIAINQQLASWDCPLNSGDCLLLIPPVAGG
jgi:Molybdopterin converting factor, small subunit